MQKLTTIEDVRQLIAKWRNNKEFIAFVPTMGNLHEGHLSLIKQALSGANRVVVSIYVNPLQFSGSNDFATYPRTLEQDQQLLDELEIDLLFIPPTEEIYPRAMALNTKVVVPQISERLCGVFRPGHFTGVATVVNKLLNIVQPHSLFLGEKDYQQLLVVRQMVQDLNMDISVEGVPTIREVDGLAMSSRNQYLNREQRAIASVIYRTLKEVQTSVLQGHSDLRAIENAAMETLARAELKPEYVSICDTTTLLPASESTPHKIVLAAAWLGKARLIDNVIIT